MNKLRIYIAFGIALSVIVSLMVLGFYLLLLILPILLIIFFFSTISGFFASSNKTDSGIIDAEYEVIDEDQKKINQK